MWGRRDQPEPSPEPAAQPHVRQPTPAPSAPPPPAPARTRVEHSQPVVRDQPEKAHAQVGKSFFLKGEITGSEDLYVDGEIRGKIDLKGHNLTVGPNGKVQADVTAQSITILGYLEGALRAEQKVDIRKTGSVEGDLVTSGIMIEEGAVFRGSIDIVKPGEAQRPAPSGAASQPDSKPKPEQKAEAQPKKEDPAQAPPAGLKDTKQEDAEPKRATTPEGGRTAPGQPGSASPRPKPAKPAAWEANQKSNPPKAKSG